MKDICCGALFFIGKMNIPQALFIPYVLLFLKSTSCASWFKTKLSAESQSSALNNFFHAGMFKLNAPAVISNEKVIRQMPCLV